MPPKRTIAAKKAPAAPEKKVEEKKPEPKVEAPPPPPAEPVKPKTVPHVPIKKLTGKEAAAKFDQKMMQSFKDAFEVMDDNKDGIVDKKDLIFMFGSVGQAATDEEVDAMLKEAPGPINFETFVTMFGERYSCRDTEEEILAGFRKFDPENTGKIPLDLLNKILSNPKVNPLDEAELRRTNKKLPVSGGMVDYKKFTQTILKEPLDLLLQA